MQPEAVSTLPRRRPEPEKGLLDNFHAIQSERKSFQSLKYNLFCTVECLGSLRPENLWAWVQGKLRDIGLRLCQTKRIHCLVQPLPFLPGSISIVPKTALCYWLLVPALPTRPPSAQLRCCTCVVCLLAGSFSGHHGSPLRVLHLVCPALNSHVCVLQSLYQAPL